MAVPTHLTPNEITAIFESTNKKQLSVFHSIVHVINRTSYLLRFVTSFSFDAFMLTETLYQNETKVLQQNYNILFSSKS